MKHTNQKDTITAKRTYKLLSQALFELLGRTSFEKLSLLELCDTAMIPRSTFYHYFEDKYDLLHCCMKTMFEEAGLNEDVIFFHSIDSIRFFVSAIIRYAEANKKQYQKIYAANKDGVLISLFQNYMATILVEKLEISEMQQKQRLHMDRSIFTALLANFYFSVIKCYLELDNPPDIDTFAEQVCRFIERDF